MIQWLRLRAPNAGCSGSIFGQGSSSNMPHLKIPHAATKTGRSQTVNNYVPEKNVNSWLAIFIPQGHRHPWQTIILPSAAPTGCYVVWQTKTFILLWSHFWIRRIISRELLCKGIHPNPDSYMATQSSTMVTYCFFNYLRALLMCPAGPCLLQSSVNLSVSSPLSRRGVKNNCAVAGEGWAKITLDTRCVHHSSGRLYVTCT